MQTKSAFQALQYRRNFFDTTFILNTKYYTGFLKSNHRKIEVKQTILYQRYLKNFRPK